VSPVKKSHKIVRHLADYVLVWWGVAVGVAIGVASCVAVSLYVVLEVLL
jgi:hypothetical protein